MAADILSIKELILDKNRDRKVFKYCCIKEEYLSNLI